VTSTLPPKTQGSIAFLLATINVLIERNVPHMKVLLECCYILHCLWYCDTLWMRMFWYKERQPLEVT